ncbi:hypothetical protein SAMN04487948_10328 [Halogranum amylolyticum]|uniref:Uncharacterized protein n=1 Tax=Halogranum amylolyticum TaxID=660520 RepID=A0A1H8QD34_9EURY|nr:hypothetical protein [Halogranum amylolyticum]SEO51693.1 hypothetical protein SAMN04487948_10328 [Halogranum amylolyticum]
MSDSSTSTDLTAEEQTAMHEVEVGLEWMLRAQGHLLAFHHAIGHGMDHLDVAETELRAAEYTTLADRIRDDILPRGVTADDRWSYSVVEEFQASFLAPLTEFERVARDSVTDGERHVAERAQERAWRERARR